MIIPSHFVSTCRRVRCAPCYSPLFARLGNKRLVIPLSLLPAKGRDGLYRIEVPGDAGSPELREIEIGLKDATRFEILSGLGAGEQVISTGTAPAPATAGTTRSSGGRGGPPPMMGL